MMTKVKMKVNTSWNHKKLSKGDVIEVSKFLGDRWEAQNICEIVKLAKKKQVSKAVEPSKQLEEPSEKVMNSPKKAMDSSKKKK